MSTEQPREPATDVETCPACGDLMPEHCAGPSGRHQPTPAPAVDPAPSSQQPCYPAGGEHCIVHSHTEPAPPDAAATETTERLWEEVRDELSGWPLGGGYYQYTVGTDEAAEMTDALLSGPLASLVADADTVRRVRELAEQWTAEADDDERWLNGPRVGVSEAQEYPATIRQARSHVADLLRALDGRP